MQIYSNMVNNGRIEFNDGKLHIIKYIITDAKGNKSTLEFNVLADAKAIINTPTYSSGTLLGYNKINEFNNDDIKVIFPKGTLYNDLNFTYKKLNKASNSFSSTHQIHNNLTPLHTGFELWIKADSNLSGYENKAVIVNTNRVSQGGYFENGFVKAKPKVFGSFFITVDTIAPQVIPVNITSNMSEHSKMSFKISDNLSGIKSFNGFIDNKWILMEFDTKSSNLWHTFDEHTQPGKHTFELLVVDMKDNVKRYITNFTR
jgi:hypothetical protein